MARYIGSKVKRSRRVSKNLFNKGSRSFSAKDEFAKRPYKPGQHGNKRFARTSEFGKQLLQKQILKFSYGLFEKQLANVFKKAFRQTGDTGKIVVSLLERRLDNVIYRAGLSNSRDQARQLVNHGHFQVNGKNVNVPSYMVQAGDIVSVKPNKANNGFWESFQLQVPNEAPKWLDTTKKQTVKIINLPLEEDLPQDLHVGAVVEYYSRKVR